MRSRWRRFAFGTTTFSCPQERKSNRQTSSANPGTTRFEERTIWSPLDLTMIIIENPIVGRYIVDADFSDACCKGDNLNIMPVGRNPRWHQLGKFVENSAYLNAMDLGKLTGNRYDKSDWVWRLLDQVYDEHGLAFLFSLLPKHQALVPTEWTVVRVL